MKFKEKQSPVYNIDFTNIGQDLRGAYGYSKEYANRHYPKLQYREIDRIRSSPDQELSGFWGEHTGGIKVSREITVRTFVEFVEAAKQTHTKRGNEIDRNTRFSWCIPILQDVDLYPTVGDHIFYAGFNYELVTVYVRPEDFWLQSNIPVYVSADAVIYRPGDLNVKPSNQL